MKAVIRVIYVKKYDVETDKCYYENTKTGAVSDFKPINSRSEDLDDPDTGVPLGSVRFAKNMNKGLQPEMSRMQTGQRSNSEAEAIGRGRKEERNRGREGQGGGRKGESESGGRSVGGSGKQQSRLRLSGRCTRQSVRRRVRTPGSDGGASRKYHIINTP